MLLALCDAGENWCDKGEARVQGGYSGDYQTHPGPGVGWAGGHRTGPSGQCSQGKRDPL